MNDQQVHPEDRVVEETYAATLDPDRYESLLVAWSDYISHLPEGADGRFHADNVNAHFQRALAILDRMGRARAHEESARSLADQMPGPAVVFRPEGKVVGVNQACHSLLAGHMPEGLADLELDPLALSSIRSWVKRNSVSEGDDDFLFLASRIGPEGVEARLLLTRVTLHQGTAGPDQEAMLLAAVDIHLDTSMATQLQEIYGLSQAEVDVSVRLSRGDSPEKIARDRLAGIATVRTQIRGILTKLGVASVTDAVRLLSSFGATVNTARAISRQAPALREIDRWRKRRTMTLSDGRSLSWIEQGDPAGRPVLFFHHFFLSPRWTEPSVEALARQGWRVIAPSRPGFGASDSVSVETIDDRIDLVSQSMAELVSRLETGPLIVAGHANGLIHAQAFAVARPDLTRALLSIGGETCWEDGMEANLPWHHKVVATTLLKAPSAIGFLARAAVSMIDGGREELIFKTFHRESPTEQMAIRRPEVRDVVLDGFRHMVRQGSSTIVTEIRMAMTDRRDVARNVSAPYHIIHGMKDNVFKPEMVELFAATVPSVKKVISVPDAGQYLLYTHWPQVIAALETLWKETSAGRN